MSGALAAARVPPFARARVSDAMAPGVITCPADASLATVARIMSANRVHVVVVAGPGERPTRAVSDRDLLEAMGNDPQLRSAGDAAQRALPTVAPEDSLADATGRMAEDRVSHVLVVDSNGAPAGVLSALDVAAVLAREAAGG